MSLQLCQWMGTGTDRDGFRPSNIDALTDWSAWDLRTDPTLQTGFCLVDCASVIPGALRTIGSAPGDTLTAAARNFINNRLGTGFTDTRLGDFLQNLALNPPAGKWRPVRAPDGPGAFELWIGQLWFSVPKIAGGAPIDPRRVWLPRHLSLSDVEEWQLAPFTNEDGETWWTVPVQGASALATDDFNRADNADLGTNWDVQTSESALQVKTNKADSVNDVGDRAENYNAVTWPNDQYSQGVITLSGVTFTAQDGQGFGLRMSTSAKTYYRIVFNSNGTNNVGIAKKVAGAFTGLVTRSSTFASGDTGYGEIQGTTLQAKINGSNAGASTTDSDIASGRAGLAYSAEGTPGGASQWDTWEGGDFSGAAVTPRPLAALGVGT